MSDHPHQSVAARRVFVGASDVKVVATVYVPCAVSEDEWRCAFDIQGLALPVRSEARGIDSLQALTLAIAGVRLTLSRSGESLTWDEGECGDYGIPRYIPQGFGLAVERHLVAKVESELAALVAQKEGASGSS